LHQGLRIAPKEAPVTGYMFGKVPYNLQPLTRTTANLQPL
jgi:hypothetical protein